MQIIKFNIKGLKKINLQKTNSIIFFFENYGKSFFIFRKFMLKKNNYKVMKYFMILNCIIDDLNFFNYLNLVFLNIKDLLFLNFFYLKFFNYGLSKHISLFFLNFLNFCTNFFNIYNLYFIFCIFIKQIVFFIFEYIKSISKSSEKKNC